jgi:hypothetical protein
LSGTINTFYEINEPSVERSFLNGHKSEGKTGKPGEKSEGETNNCRPAETIENITDEDTGGKIDKLANRHITYQFELEGGNVLWNGMLFHTMNL